MDSTFITAAAAAAGSLVGAVATIGTTWITQRTQSARAKIEAKLRDREALYGEFITEASRLTVEALTHSLEQAESLVKLYGILGRIRLVATDPVLASAEACCRQIIDFYPQQHRGQPQPQGRDGGETAAWARGAPLRPVQPGRPAHPPGFPP